MDSTRRRVAIEPSREPGEPIPTVSPTLAVRLGQALPLLRRAESLARRVAQTSAIAAVVLAVALEWGNFREGVIDWPIAIAGLCVLLAPAALTWLGVSTLRELVSLPARLKTGAAEAAERARAVVSQSSRGARVGGFVKALWAARALVQDARGVASVGTAVRLVKLTRLPLLVLMTLGFVLNFVVIAAAIVAVLVVVVV